MLWRKIKPVKVVEMWEEEQFSIKWSAKASMLSDIEVVTENSEEKKLEHKCISF